MYSLLRISAYKNAVNMNNNTDAAASHLYVFEEDDVLLFVSGKFIILGLLLFSLFRVIILVITLSFKTAGGSFL